MRLQFGRLAAVVVSCGLLAAAVATPAVASGSTQTYLILYAKSGVPTDAGKTIAAAGGTIVARYDDIGVAVARSDNGGFMGSILKDGRVEGAAATARFGVQLRDTTQSGGGAAAITDIPASTSDSLSGLQWDMAQIHAPAAHAITGGDRSVVVGDIDTGLDFTHPDLAANVDDADSASCIGGAAVQGKVAANDDNGHGTHTAGTIAAAANGIGIVGVAPGVRIAAIKAGNADGFFFPEAVVCAFMWAGSHHIDVTNNSYFADPWLFNCRNDAEQRAIWKAERRAIGYAQGKGVVVVAAEGNQADDLSHPTADATSPDDTNPVLRQIHNDCAVVPVEVAGVIGVTADGDLGFKSFYSSYGTSTTDVMAPGGDSVLQRTTAAANGRVLSTWPAALMGGCSRQVIDSSGATYCYAQGTSMASPHVAGVAALIKSQHPGWMPGAVRAAISNGAAPIACPADESIYAFFPAVDNGAPQHCTGGAGHNSFSGHGRVDALAVLR